VNRNSTTLGRFGLAGLGSLADRLTLETEERGIPGFRRPVVEIPPAPPGERLFRRDESVGRRGGWQDLTPLAGGRLDSAAPILVYRLRTGIPVPLRLRLRRFLSCESGAAWDLTLNILARLEDPAAFLGSPLLEMLDCRGRISPEDLSGWLCDRISPGLHDAIAGRNVKDLQDPIATPVFFWQDVIGCQGSAQGLGLTLDTAPVWSPAKEHEEDSRRRERQTQSRREPPHETTGDRSPLIEGLLQGVQDGRQSFAEACFESEKEGLHDRFVTAAACRLLGRPTERFAEDQIRRARRRGAAFTIRVGSGVISTRRSILPQTVPHHPDFPVLAVHIGSHIGLRLCPPHDGCLTLINPGTSGRFFLLTPNDNATVLRVKGGRVVDSTMMIPGTPQIQHGPPGEEYVVAFVTPEPLFTAEELARDQKGGLSRTCPDLAECLAPQRHIAPGRIIDLEKALERLEPGSWSMGFLRYLVVGQSR